MTDLNMKKSMNIGIEQTIKHLHMIIDLKEESHLSVDEIKAILDKTKKVLLFDLGVKDDE